MKPPSTPWVVIALVAGSLTGFATSGVLAPPAPSVSASEASTFEAFDPEMTDQERDDSKLLTLCERWAGQTTACRLFQQKTFEHGPMTVTNKLFTAARELFAGKDYEGTKALMVECVRREPNAKGCHRLLSVAYAQLGDAHLAEVEHATYLALPPHALPSHGPGDFGLDLPGVPGE